MGSNELEGQTAIILGGANGVGMACAELFARADARVLVADIDAESGRRLADRLDASGQRVRFATCDVRDLDAVQALVDRCEVELGVPDVGLYATGIIKPAPFLDLTVTDFDLVMDVNLRGAVFFFQALARRLVKAGRGGSLVSISSVGGQVAGDSTHAYGTSKAGLIHLAKSMAVSLAPYGIRANSVGPGGVATAMQAHLSPEERHASLSRTPMLRLARPEEIAQVALFLASEASSYVTGQTIFADGGRLALHRTVKVPQ
ncbi:SDR family NAD(P)-dependent oxidoreductase [Hydrogenophaga sp. BPS33]|uniref:SDR family NAD(P)-dependent oxidoreductase n=1 Tax=Hydrogenophaga sp. BPS33 TaxID=2651974 RepID=UPI0013201FA1|nr:SDR family oxidoreductase [Hydrogenophaga sp. BPS33]QHE84774.1 SDR family oxidoreductase [Hydrogenophaga sp. BPS33]